MSPASINVLACFILLQFSCSHANGQTGTVVKIKSGRVPKEKTSFHKPHDVEIYKTKLAEQNAYTVRYYRKENDTLRTHMGMYIDTLDFNKATCTWINDSSIDIRLIKTATKQEEAFILSGYGQTNCMRTKE